MSKSLYDLTDQVAIVTGGGKGIGKALSMGLADAGCCVVICARQLEPLEEVAESIRAKGGKAIAVSMDHRKQENVQNMVDRAVEEFGRIDILVNNAGGQGFLCDMVDLSLGGWNAVINVNLQGVFLCSKLVGEVMIKQGGGKIVNITSVAGRDGTPGSLYYGTAKAAITNFSQGLSVEWAKYNIRVNCVGPGPVKTENAMELTFSSPEIVKRVTAGVALNRFAEPEEILGPVMFFASDASSYVTGQSLYVDGGVKRSTFED
jgi:NAD(P)-dependent dehydrogenase (short-subunit alcohol dehydrogenase family)